jgi:cell division protein FtsW
MKPTARADSAEPRTLSGPRVDTPMLLATLALVVLGVVMVGSSSGPIGQSWTGDAHYFFKRQALFAVLGAAALFAGAAVSPATWQRRALPLLGVGFALLVVVLIPGIGQVVGGARRWIALGPVGLQAGEVMKLVLVVFLAAAIASRAEGARDRPARWGRLLAVPVAATALLMLEPDFGTSVLLLVISLIMIFVAGARLSMLAGLLALALPLGLLAISTSAYRMRRVLAFLDPWAHRNDIGYQITESLMTVGSGGALGLGLGASKQKLFFLPAAHTDFIFAVVGEELGLMGVSAALACFAVIGWRALRAAARTENVFLSHLILGLSSLLMVQTLFNVAVVLGLVPTKGITLPFVSYGGSSLVLSMLMAGVLMRACADATEAAPRRARTRPVLERGIA